MPGLELDVYTLSDRAVLAERAVLSCNSLILHSFERSAQCVAHALRRRRPSVVTADKASKEEQRTWKPSAFKTPPAWRFQVIAAFVIALGLTTVGILYLPMMTWVKGYLLMGLYFTVSSAFGLAKSLRDAHESTRLVTKISEAKTERILRDLAQA